MDFKINQNERNALMGLPHLLRLTYFVIRPYMDYATGIVGIKRGISYQSLREELYVETQRGKTGGSPSKDQMRRVIKSLERAGLVSIQSEDKQLILKCELATWDNCEQNLPARRAPYAPATRAPSQNSLKTSGCAIQNAKAAIPKNALPATPPVSGINTLVFVLENAFEKFWQLYPVKFSKQKTWEAFVALSPTTELFEQMMQALAAQCDYRKKASSHNHWMPHWKNAANWITQRTWEDELPSDQFLSGEINRARCKDKYSKTKQSKPNALWDYCQDAFAEESESENNNVICISAYKQT